MGSPPLAGGLLAQAVGAMDDGRFGGSQLQVERDLVLGGAEAEGVFSGEFAGPIVDPDELFCRGRDDLPVVRRPRGRGCSKTRLTIRTAGKFLEKMKFPGGKIAHGEVGKLHIAGDEARKSDDVLIAGENALTEKRELIAEGAAVLGGKVAGEIPPFGFESGVAAVVGREDVFPAGFGHAPFRLRGKSQSEQQEGNPHQFPATTASTPLVPFCRALIFQRMNPPWPRGPRDFSN